MKPKPQTSKAILLQKIFAVMAAIPELEKTGEKTNDQSGELEYRYHEADGIRGPLRDELIKNRLLLLPTDVQVSHFVNQTSTGGYFNYSEQLITFSWFDIDTAERLDCKAVGWGGDSLDKAAPKASIQALKYFVTNGLHICGIELDGDSEEEQTAGREANKAHIYMEGFPDACVNNSEGKALDHPWILVDGIRAFSNGKNKKITSQLKKLANMGNPTKGMPRVKVRAYMGSLNGNKNAQPIIDKIQIIEPQVEIVP